MSKGTVFPSEIVRRRDPVTGLRFRQLTNGPEDSHHLYFTNPGWFDGGRRLLFVSTRNGATDLFGMDLESGAFVQLTDERCITDSFMFASLNPVRPEAYFWRSGALVALDLETLDERTLFVTPEGYANNILSVTCDGAALCTGIYEDLRHRFKVDLLKGYVGFDDYWAANPHSIILAVDTASGHSREVFSENAWIGHVNTSPAVAHLLSYCHEGPWHKVDNRIWGLDLRDGRSWMIRPRQRGESVGHEYWLQDGVTIGFHGQERTGANFSGTIQYDNTGLQESPFPMKATHVHSNDTHLIVGDGTKQDPTLHIWKLETGMSPSPVAILRHDCSASVQARHVHPRFSPDSSRLVFVSDAGGVGNLFEVLLADIHAAGLLGA